MTNIQLFISVGVPLIVLIAGFVWQNRAIHEGLAALRNEMLSRFDGVKEQFDGVNARLDSLERRVGVIESDLRQFYSITGNHEGRISAIEKR